MITWIKSKNPKNTRASYDRYQDEYTAFAQRKGLDVSKAVTLCAFMKYGLDERGWGRSLLTSTIPAAVEDFFRFEDTSPRREGERLLASMKKAIKKSTKASVARKPVGRGMLEKMALRVHAEKVVTLKACRDMFMAILMFVGFLRESEAVGLLAEDVWVEDEMPDGSKGRVLYMVIKHSKTDKYGENATVVVSEAFSSTRYRKVRWRSWVRQPPAQ